MHDWIFSKYFKRLPTVDELLHWRISVNSTDSDYRQNMLAVQWSHLLPKLTRADSVPERFKLSSRHLHHIECNLHIRPSVHPVQWRHTVPEHHQYLRLRARPQLLSWVIHQRQQHV